MLQDAFGNTIEHDVPATQDSYAHINDLPTEVLIHIFCNLSPTDLKELRLVCHKWNYAVLDKTTWIKAFDNRFNTGNVFASVTRSLLWLLEYFGRVALTKKWAKGRAFSNLYQLVNDRFSHHYIDFQHDRLLAFSRLSGSVSLCSLSLGKNQVFMPESNIVSGITAYDTNYNYLVVANDDGSIYLKNLLNAKSSGSTLLSMKKLHAGPIQIAGLKLNPAMDRNKEKPDIVGVTCTGTLMWWNMENQLVHKIETERNVLKLDTDFKTLVIVVTAEFVFVVDFCTSAIINSFEHGLEFESLEPIFASDFNDNNIVLATPSQMKVFHLNSTSYAVLQTKAPEGVSIIDGTIQACHMARNVTLAGGDGLLFAATFSDGSVGVYNIRELNGTIPMKCRIMQFEDNRTPQGIAQYTKVALNSTVIAIGALPDWVHFYDAHSGRYLREGSKVRRILTRNGTEPVLQIQLNSDDASGVVVSGDLVQFFRFGDVAFDKKRPNAPLAPDTNSRRAMAQHIKSEIAEYDELEQSKMQREILADKYNGTEFDNEQEELRIALALSASVEDSAHDSDAELRAALEALARDCQAPDLEDSDDLVAAIKLSQMDAEGEVLSSGAREGSSRLHEDAVIGEDSEEETLRRVLRLSLADH